MASLALGAAGGYMFGPLGFLIGSALGNLLFPQKQEGPRLTDLHTQTSAYGEMIPIGYGTMRVSGKVFWADEKQEHTHKSGGKGGPSVTTYTYTCSFFTTFGEGPIVDIPSLWFDSQKVFDVNDPDSPSFPMTVYYGTETQEPDSTMEAVLGVGNVPAYRGICGIVFEDLELAEYGNRIPNIEALVQYSGGTIPWRVSYFIAVPSGTNSGPWGATYDGTYITIGKYFISGGLANYQEMIVDIDGNVIGSPPTTTVSVVGQDGSVGLVGIVDNLNVALCWWNPGSGGVCGWFSKGVQTAFIGANPAGGSVTLALDGAGLYMHDKIYTMSAGPGNHAPYLVQWNAPSGVPTAIVDAMTLVPSGDVGDMKLGVNYETSMVYVLDTGAAGGGTPAPTYPTMWRYDESLTLDHTWTWSELPTDLTSDLISWVRMIVVYRDIFCAHIKDGALQYAYAWRINSDETFTFIGRTEQNNSGTPAPILQPTLREIRLSGGLVISDDGVISLVPPDTGAILGDIVGDLSSRSGLSSGSPFEYDTSDLPDIVPGYIISNQVATRDAISPLQNAWPFDAVERDEKVVFVRRGKTSVLTIPEDDLAARSDSGQPPVILGIKRGLEQDLPRTLNVNYLNLGSDYQKGSQYERRLITDSQVAITVDMAIAMTDTFGKSVAAMLLFNAWWSRVTFTFYTSDKYAYLEPTDIVTIRNYIMRITNKTEQSDGVIAFEAIQDDPSIWLRTSAASGGVGQASNALTSKAPSVLTLFDLPLIADADAANGYYAAMYSSTGASQWSARLYKSTDGGTTYTDVDGTVAADVMGTTDEALGNYTGGNFFDEGNILPVTIGVGGGTLSSVSASVAMNGGNAFAIGSEIVYVRDATLTAAGQYDLSGLLRGRRGTEWAIASHFAGETFVQLPTTMNPEGPLSEVQIPVKFKGVTKGATVASATAVDFTNMGAALRCYAPVQLGGGVVNASGDVTIQWVRRDRKGAVIGLVPMSEATEAYVVQIWDASYTICARIIEVTTQSHTYTGAEQITDFGSEQQIIYFTVVQIGAGGLGTQAYGTAPGLGVYISTPLVPIIPYHDNPIISPPPPTGGSLPVDHIFTQPTEVVDVTMVVGQKWVGQFTTGSTLPTSGSITVFEFGGPTLMREMVLSTDSGGTLIYDYPYGVSIGTTCTLRFATSAIVLQTLTTYYVVIDFSLPSGYPAPIDTPAPSRINFSGIPS